MVRDRGAAPWLEIERVYHGARELEGHARVAFLDAECGSDIAVRQEVESLLAFETSAGTYLERPAIEFAARAWDLERAPLRAGRKVGGYEIVELLGSGGMSDVYLARDLRLERDVALKVLHRTVAEDPGWVRRFEEEARAASGLAHPSIVTIYGVGDDGELAYIAMELVRGRTLREVLATGGMDVAGAVDIAAQFAEALAVAHAAGIVHRDLKPENLMVTPDGRLKVLDFGIAKRGARPDVAGVVAPAAHGATGQGVILGTLGYMSPEQAEGRPVDHRSDQFSFGAVVYELLSGARAFERGTRTGTMRALREADLTGLPPLPGELPSALREVVRRCLSRRPEDRYAETSTLALELRKVGEALRNRDANGLMTRRHMLWLSGAAALSAAAGAVAWRAMVAVPAVRSLAVLPFANVDGDPDLEYLCDGITEHLIRRIGYVPDLEVRSRSVVFNLKQAGLDLVEAGTRLRVDSVLAGTVAAQGQRVLVTARLIDVASGAETWAERYERPAADLLGLQHALAQAIVDQGIRRPLVGRNRRRFDQEPTENAEALDAFLRGVYEHRQGGEAHYLGARRLLADAVSKDPTFALAHVSLASTFSAMAVDGFERPTSAWPEANRSIRRALEIDPDLPEAHAEQASAWFFFDRDWSAAEREWTRALAPGQSPALPDLLSGAAIMLWALGRTDEALAMARRARALDSLTPRFGALEGDLLLHGGQAPEAAQVYEATLAQSPDHAATWFGLAEARRVLGQDDAAISALRQGYERALSDVPAPLAEALARAKGEAGYRDVDRVAVALELETLRAHQTQGAYVSPLDLARGYARAGDADRVFEHLEAAFEERSPGLVFLKVDRAWAAVRADARFADAVQAVGLP